MKELQLLKYSLREEMCVVLVGGVFSLERNN